MQSVDVRTGTLVGTPDQEIDEVDLVPVRTYWQLVRKRFLRHRLAVIALVVLAIMIVVSTIVPLATGDAYKRSSIPLINDGPSLQAPLGYNQIGQNQFVRLMRASQTTLVIGFAAVFLIGDHRHRRRRDRGLLRRLDRQRADALRGHHPVAAVPVPDPDHREPVRLPGCAGGDPRHRDRRAGRPPPGS